MKRMCIKDYLPSMGKLIDVQDYMSYNENHYPGSININFDKLLLHYKELLNKQDKYFIICKNGHKSKKAVNILEFYGYDVTQVYYE